MQPTHSVGRSLLALFSVVVFLLPLTGCGGCSKTSDPAADEKAAEEKKAAAEKKKKNEKPVEDFSLGRILAEPSEVIKDRPEINYVKRGHWVAASQRMRANNFDAVQSELRSITASSDGTPFDIEHTNYALAYSRPIPLPKGQVKTAESLFFVPRERVDARPPQLRNELRPNVGGAGLQLETTPAAALDEWQYLFLVLSSRPSAFNVLEQTQTFAPATDNVFAVDPSIRYYQLVRPSVDRALPLADNPLAWTSIAAILWDDIDPEKITFPQQQAMLDWLHWGGQLIISGPNSLDRLRDTFLEPYLPASNKRSRNLTQDSFNELNEFWSLKRHSKPQITRDLKLVKEIAGIELELAPHGSYVPHTGELAAEGRVGQGRIVITGFSLASGAVQTWANFDGFLNGALLHRPAREFVHTRDDQKNIVGFRTEWAAKELEKFRRDSRLISNIRYFSRDMGFAPGDEKQHPYDDLRLASYDPNFSTGEPSPLLSRGLDAGDIADRRFGGYLAVPRAGVGSWNDFSGTVNVARRHLNDAAGVTIPKAGFVAKVLFVYLLVLVPLNWLVFRSIGRVEWAWLAAPVIAVVGAVTVIRLAQLDIGFARSRTEIDVVEMQGGYSRAHVSRFIALYTSLASGYKLTFDEPTAIAQPLAINPTYRRGIGETPYEVQLRRDTKLSFSGFQVRSNSTGSLHAEQIFDAGGGLELVGSESTQWQVKNGTTFDLRDAGVFRRSTAGEYYAAYIKSLPAGATAAVTFQPTDQADLWLNQWQASAVMAKVGEAPPVTGELRLGRFAELATQQLTLQLGDARLVAWMPREIDGVGYAPDSAQVNGITFLLCHLRRGALPEPQRDRNVLQDVSTIAESESTNENNAAAPMLDPPDSTTETP